MDSQNRHILIYPLLNELETRFWCLNIYFLGQVSEWDNCKIFIFGEFKMAATQLLFLLIFLYKFCCKVAAVSNISCQLYNGIKY